MENHENLGQGQDTERVPPLPPAKPAKESKGSGWGWVALILLLAAFAAGLWGWKSHWALKAADAALTEAKAEVATTKADLKSANDRADGNYAGYAKEKAKAESYAAAQKASEALLATCQEKRDKCFTDLEAANDRLKARSGGSGRKTPVVRAIVAPPPMAMTAIPIAIPRDCAECEVQDAVIDDVKKAFYIGYNSPN